MLGLRCRLDQAEKLSGADDVRGPLDERVSCGLMSRVPGGSEVGFDHPLTRAAIYHDVPPGNRAALHRRAAAMMATQAESLHHRAAAALGPDDDLARELVRFGIAEQGRAA